MLLKKRIGQKLLVILIISSIGLIGCGSTGIEFDTDYYVGDYNKEQIINENSIAVSCKEPAFNSFGCLSATKIKELAKILNRCSCPESGEIKEYLEKAILPLEGME